MSYSSANCFNMSKSSRNSWCFADFEISPMFGGGFARGVLLRGGARRRQRAELLGELLRWQRAAQRPAGETTNRKSSDARN